MQRNWQSGLKPLLAYYLINLLLELIEQSNCIVHKWFHTFWKELQCVSMAEIVAEGKVWLQVVQQYVRYDEDGKGDVGSNAT